MLEDLPQVGSIVEGSDTERVARLVTWLRTLFEQRAQRYQKAGAGSITEYRTRAGAPDEPRILLLLDGAAAFRQAYEIGDPGKVLEQFIAVATEGRPVGVHVLVAADRPAAVPSALASALQTRVVLRMAETSDYAMMGLPADVLSPLSPPGRGLLGISEIQVAQLGPSPDLVSQAVYARRFAEARRRAGGGEAPAVRRLTDRVTLAELPVEVDGAPVIGLSYDTLGPMTCTPRGSFPDRRAARFRSLDGTAHGRACPPPPRPVDPPALLRKPAIRARPCAGFVGHPGVRRR
jgi:S-DNA-T family DNA segregation ATPase FtsK/SpoIIIE